MKAYIFFIFVINSRKKCNSYIANTRVTYTAFVDTYMPTVVHNSFTNFLDNSSVHLH